MPTTRRSVHLLCNLRALTFLLILCVDGLLLLLDKSGLQSEVILALGERQGTGADRRSAAHLFNGELLICLDLDLAGLL